MNSLLKRQIRKYLPKDLAENEALAHFLSVVDNSYTTFDDQFSMQQRAMSISSNELFEANQQLREESKGQQEIIDKLKHILNTLKFYDLPEDLSVDIIDFDEFKLVEYLGNLTQEIIQINKQRETLLEELEHQNQELSDYAHMVSHDLKSPLRSLYSLATWLCEDYEAIFDETGKQTLKLIKTNVEKMDNLISGILEYSTINKNQIEVYDIDLNKLIKEVLSTINVPNHINITNTKLPVIKGDKYRLQQLFQNLISNAIKYNDKDKGVIVIDVEEQEDSWLFSIKDNGKGIDALYYDKIFKTFEKLEDTPDSTGIGLSIVKKIVELYNGKIWLTSTPGVGTTFLFTLKK